MPRPSIIHPLLKSVRQARGSKFSVNEINVISPGLCNDIINRLETSLLPHKGCTIIDINPGPAIFSSILHNHLKPRSHILVEPLQEYHKPFLQPLVDASKSKYHLRDYTFAESVDLSTYIRDGLLSPADTKTDSTYPGRNDSILVLASMARGSRSRDGNSGHLNSSYRILSFINALRHRAGLNTQGPVRILLWLADKENHGLLPQNVNSRKKKALQLETYYHVEEIVGGCKRGKQLRENEVDLASGRRVLQRMQDTGIEIPDHRKDDMQKEVEKSQDGLSQATSALSRDWEIELQQREEAFKNGEFSQHIGGPRGQMSEGRAGEKGLGALTSEWRRLRYLRNYANSRGSKQTVLEGLLQKEEKIDSLQIELLHGDLDATERQTKLSQQEILRDDVKTTLDREGLPISSPFSFQGDERRAFALDPPLLMWDRRGAEPLLAQDDEFYQARKLALLDLQPRLNPFPMTQEEMVYFDYLSTHLFYHGHQTVKSLNHIAPGAFEALAPQVPELLDPSKGGRYDLEELRTRNLTPEMMYKLVRAWRKWAFKPSISELMEQERFDGRLSGGDDQSRFGGAFKPMRDS